METNIRVLIVEDHEILRTGLNLILGRAEGMEVIGSCGDGLSAVDQAMSLKPDVILMDIGLPVLDGIEATRLIKTNLPDTRILIFTAYENDEFLFAAFAAGADGYCTKMGDMNCVENAIRTVATGAAWLDVRVASRVLTSVKQTAQKPQTSNYSSFGLTEREYQVLELIVEGLSNKEIADRLVITLDTVKSHVRSIMNKLSVHDRTQAAVKAIRSGISINGNSC
jgi:two-component system, NarL family, response regulator LiaR